MSVSCAMGAATTSSSTSRRLTRSCRLELFEAVQRINERRSSGRGVAVNKAKSLLAGIAQCEGCGRGLVSSETGSARRRSYKCPADSRLCSARAHILAEALDTFVIERVLEWAGPAADELVEVEVELTTDAERLVAERRLGQAEAALEAHEADVELELEIGAEAYKAGRRARVELVERRRQELEALGEATELEAAQDDATSGARGRRRRARRQVSAAGFWRSCSRRSSSSGRLIGWRRRANGPRSFSAGSRAAAVLDEDGA